LTSSTVVTISWRVDGQQKLSPVSEEVSVKSQLLMSELFIVGDLGFQRNMKTCRFLRDPGVSSKKGVSTWKIACVLGGFVTMSWHLY
jgi:hypothetical protein